MASLRSWLRVYGHSLCIHIAAQPRAFEEDGRAELELGHAALAREHGAWRIRVQYFDIAASLRAAAKSLRGQREEQDLAARFLERLPGLEHSKMWYMLSSNLVRYLILYLHGGIWFDTDVISLRRLPEPVMRMAFTASQHYRPHEKPFNGCVMGAPPKNVWVRTLLVQALNVSINKPHLIMLKKQTFGTPLGPSLQNGVYNADPKRWNGTLEALAPPAFQPLEAGPKLRRAFEGSSREALQIELLYSRSPTVYGVHLNSAITGGLSIGGDSFAEWLLQATHAMATFDRPGPCRAKSSKRASQMAPALPRLFPDVTSALDFGGNVGELLAGFAARRVPELYVLEPFDNSRCMMSGVRQLMVDIFQKGDLKKGGASAHRFIPKRVDLLMSIEVADQIKAEHHPKLVSWLEEHTGRWLVFSAAQPDQFGHHVAPRPASAWREDLQRRGVLRYDDAMTAKVKGSTDAPVVQANLMVFSRVQRGGKGAAASGRGPQPRRPTEQSRKASGKKASGASIERQAKAAPKEPRAARALNNKAKPPTAVRSGMGGPAGMQGALETPNGRIIRRSNHPLYGAVDTG